MLVVQFLALLTRPSGHNGVRYPTMRTSLMNLKRTFLLAILLTITVAHAQGVHNGEGLLRAMHNRYQASWY